MLLVFGLVSGLWMTTALHHIDYAVVALVGVSASASTSSISDT